MSMKGTNPRPKLVCGEGRTKQAFKDEADINNIVARYRATGMLPHVAARRGVFADVSKLGDFRTQLDTLTVFKQAFETLPAVLRSRFGNDPATLVEFLQDPANLEESVKLGLREALPPVPAPPAPEPPAPPAGEGAGGNPA